MFMALVEAIQVVLVNPDQAQDPVQTGISISNYLPKDKHVMLTINKLAMGKQTTPETAEQCAMVLMDAISSIMTLMTENA